MVRPVDWHPLTEADPVPGDPEYVTQAVANYRKVAESIRGAAANLLRVATADTTGSDAVNAFREKAGTVREDLLKVESRYVGLADALGGYVQPLREAQAESVSALISAQEAAQAQRNAQNAAQTAQQEAQYEQDPMRQQDLVAQQRTAEHRQGQAETNLADARNRLRLAVEKRDDAAGVAQQKIQDTEVASAVRDTALDRVQEAVGDIAVTVGVWLDEIGKALEKLDAILSIIQVVLLVAAFVFPPAGALALGLKVVFGVIKVISTIAKVVGAVRTAAKVARLVTGHEKGGLKAIAAIGAQYVAGKVIGKAADKLGGASVKGAQNQLKLSQTRRYVQQGRANPGLRGQNWMNRSFPKDSVAELVTKWDSSTVTGRRAIARAGGENWLIHQSESAVKTGVFHQVDNAFGIPASVR